MHLKETEHLTAKSILQTFVTLPVAVKKWLTRYNDLLRLLAGIIFTYSLSIRFLNDGQAIHAWSWWTFMGGCHSPLCTSFVHWRQCQHSPSEVTIGCTAQFMYQNTRKENISHVFDNLSAYVVDDKLNVIPKGGGASYWCLDCWLGVDILDNLTL